jgi:hypothetical protein
MPPSAGSLPPSTTSPSTPDRPPAARGRPAPAAGSVGPRSSATFGGDEPTGVPGRAQVAAHSVATGAEVWSAQPRCRTGEWFCNQASLRPGVYSPAGLAAPLTDVGWCGALNTCWYDRTSTVAWFLENGATWGWGSTTFGSLKWQVVTSMNGNQANQNYQFTNKGSMTNSITESETWNYWSATNLTNNPSTYTSHIFGTVSAGTSPQQILLSISRVTRIGCSPITRLHGIRATRVLTMAPG